MNEQMIHTWWRLMTDGFTEVRVLAGRITYSGYFKDVENVIRALRSVREQNAQYYFTLNQLSDGCYSREQRERLAVRPKATTTDNDITRRRWILVDFDPKRPTWTSSTDEELNEAHDMAGMVYRNLKAVGFPTPVVCKSGNGWHLLYKVDLPNDAHTTQTVKDFLRILSTRYGNDKVDIDEKVFNAGRICKLYGTEARKGANTEERPWRMATIEYEPKPLATLPQELLEAYVAQNTVHEERPRTSTPGGQFSLSDFMARHSIAEKSVKHMPDGRVIHNLCECPFDSSHKDGDACLIEMPSGAVAFKCFHNSCSGHGWTDFRRLYEPDIVQRNEQWKDYQPQPQRAPQPQPEPKEENSDDGKKWLDLSEIEMIDTSKMERILTGFNELDAYIHGMYMSELVILSGRAGAGKSSWINTLILNVITQGYKVAMWSGELPPHIIKMWLYNAAAGQLVKYDNDGEPHINPEHVTMIDTWIRGMVMLYNNNYGSKWSQVFSDMGIAADAGARMFILDNLMSLDIDLLADGKYDAQKEVISKLKEFATRRSVVVMLVCHPRKVTSFIRNEDISGSSDIINKADDIFIIHRVNIDFYRRGSEYLGKKKIQHFATESSDGIAVNTMEQGNVLEISKNRMHGNIDNLVGFYYHLKSRRFIGIDSYLGRWMRIQNGNSEEHALYKCDPFGWYQGDIPDVTRGWTKVPEQNKEKKTYNVDTMSPEAREIHSLSEVDDNMSHLQPDLPFMPTEEEPPF